MKRTGTAKWMENQNRWQINVQKDGVRRSFTSAKPGRTGQREANKKADAWLDDNITNDNIRARDLYKEWINELKLTTGTSHWSQYEQYGRTWILPEIGTLRVGRVAEQHIQNIITAGHKKGLAKKTLKNIRSCCVAFIKYCRKRGATKLIVENVSIPRSAPVGQRTILQPEDIRRLFSRSNTLLNKKDVPDLYVYAYRFAVATGLRPGEVIGLKWDDIKGCSISLVRSINKWGETTDGKNENAKRTFALTPIAVEILENQKSLLLEGSITSIYVFPDKYGDATKEQNLYARWHKFCSHNQIRKCSLYELRHTFISVAKSLPEGLLKQIVGHSAAMDTYDTYGHELDGDALKTAKLIQEEFSDILK